MAEIRAVPALHSECRQVAGELQRVAQPCGDELVRRALQPLALVYPPGQRAESPAFWQVYFKALANLPTEALLRACDDFPGSADDDGHFPKPGTLKSLAEKHARTIRQAAARAKRAADSLPRRPQPARDPEAVRRMAEEVGAILSSKKGQTE